MVSFIKAWGLVIISLCYTFFIARLVPKGIQRLILIIPVLLIFFIVPLLMKPSIHLLGITAFLIGWLANFKVFLFALGRGPLSSNPKPLSLPIFLAVSCLPIKIQLSTKSPKSGSHGGGSREGPLSYTIKAFLLVLLIKVYDYSSKLPDKALLTLYAIHIYITLELILAAMAAVVRAMSDLELEPQFNEPYLATSLQDFWGRRWNLMVTGILRPTVYDPMVQLFSVLGRNWSRVPAIFGTFVVSGIMHELIFFYMGRLRPDWKVMCFFLIHGFCTTVEIIIKKTINGRWKLQTAISQLLTLGFVIVTALWLFLPEFKRCNIADRAIEEYKSIGTVAAEIRSMMASLF
ncbi:PREDICTED: acyl-CoA--sterol O-acyltransferase 1-like isoform X1 [Camelina sativa]|uniref:Acyl-CoA--sterol O-acyltransferase 1-like isoform X1 n=1 Tax=Camelina sativa TaxID=90675 RepID=A0ABM0YP83_CAMSA|nr:PREDICTED: acyl-CoA--sterol O-acyltransferase 1-like isoform X1 [Camelina sativa]